MGELRPSRSRVDLRSEPVLGRSASETSSTGTRREEEGSFRSIRIGDADRLHARVAMLGSGQSAREGISDESLGISHIQIGIGWLIVNVVDGPTPNKPTEVLIVLVGPDTISRFVNCGEVVERSSSPRRPASAARSAAISAILTAILSSWERARILATSCCGGRRDRTSPGRLQTGSALPNSVSTKTAAHQTSTKVSINTFVSFCVCNIAATITSLVVLVRMPITGGSLRRSSRRSLCRVKDAG